MSPIKWISEFLYSEKSKFIFFSIIGQKKFQNFIFLANEPYFLTKNHFKMHKTSYGATISFWNPFLNHTKHMPLKCRYPNKESNRTRVVYLSVKTTLTLRYISKWYIGNRHWGFRGYLPWSFSYVHITVR